MIKNNGLYGFFGKNGEGKTTFLKSLCGLVNFKGSVNLLDKRLNTHEIAWVPTEPDVYEYLTIDEFSKFYELSSRNYFASTEKIFDIEKTKLLKQCSTGTRKKAYINAVLQFSDYSIYIFDEPFNGLDIESNYILLREIITLSEKKIVLISSHIIELIEPYLNKKFVIQNKKIHEIEIHEKIKHYFINEK